MPELPEVETCRRGIAPHLLQQKVVKVVLRQQRSTVYCERCQS